VSVLRLSAMGGAATEIPELGVMARPRDFRRPRADSHGVVLLDEFEA